MPKEVLHIPTDFRAEMEVRFAKVDERFEKIDERFEDLTSIMIAGFDRIYDKIEAESRAVSDRIVGLDSRIAELAKSRVTYDDHHRDVMRLTKRIEHVEDIIAREEDN